MRKPAPNMREGVLAQTLVTFLGFSYGLPPVFAVEGTAKPMTAVELKQKIAKVRQNLDFERKLETKLSKGKKITEDLKSANTTMGKGLRLIGELFSNGKSEKVILKEIGKVNKLISPHFRVDKDGNLIWGDAFRSLMMLGGVQAQFVGPGFTALTPETAGQIIQDWLNTNQEQKKRNEELLETLTQSGSGTGEGEDTGEGAGEGDGAGESDGTGKGEGKGQGTDRSKGTTKSHGPWFVFCAAGSAHVANTMPFNTSLGIGPYERKSRAEADAREMDASGGCKQGTCSIGHDEVPYLRGLLEAEARQKLVDVSLTMSIDGHEYSTDVTKGAVISQNPSAGACIKKGFRVSVILSKGPKPIETPENPFEAELNCGGAIEIEAGAEPSRSCDIVVRGWKSEGRVIVHVTPIPESSGIRIFPGDTSQAAFNMHTAGVSDFYDRYIFGQSISAKGTAPEGVTTIIFTVSQEGNGMVSLPLDISVLPSGRSPSHGGIRPPVERATGSGGAYCVWRYKSFGDGPNCFNIFQAECDSPRYVGKSMYELVGSGMTWMQASALASELSPYKGDAYGCHRQSAEDPNTGGGQDGGSGTGTGGDTGAGGGQGTGESEAAGTDRSEGTENGPESWFVFCVASSAQVAKTIPSGILFAAGPFELKSRAEAQARVMDADCKSGASGGGGGSGSGDGADTGEGDGTGEDEETEGGKDDDDLLKGFPDDPEDAPLAGDGPLTPEQEQAVEGFEGNGSTSHQPPSDPGQMVSGDSDDTPPVDIAAVAQAERDEADARNRGREGIQRDEDRQADEDRQTINQQNAQDQQTQDAAARQGVAQAQAQGQVLIDQANQNADPIMSGQDMADAVDTIQQEGEDKIEAIDDQIRQGLGSGGQGGGATRQPLPPPPSMGTGPVDTAVVQCNTRYGAGGDNA